MFDRSNLSPGEIISFARYSGSIIVPATFFDRKKGEWEVGGRAPRKFEGVRKNAGETGGQGARGVDKSRR